MHQTHIIVEKLMQNNIFLHTFLQWYVDVHVQLTSSNVSRKQLFLLANVFCPIDLQVCLNLEIY